MSSVFLDLLFFCMHYRILLVLLLPYVTMAEIIRLCRYEFLNSELIYNKPRQSVLVNGAELSKEVLIMEAVVSLNRTLFSSSTNEPTEALVPL